MRYALVTLAAAACVAVGGVAQASPRVTPLLHQTHMVSHTFTGRIEAINYNKDTFTVRNDHDGKVQEREFRIEPGTWVKLNGQYTVLGDLEPHDRVSVTYLAPRKRG
jgi:hypothetical protein